MDRRTFLLLAGAGSTTLLGPPRRIATSSRVRAMGRLRFELDEQRRWSLWYLGGGRPVPILQNVTVGAWIADQFLTLGDLEYSTVGTRRPPGGDVIILRGRAGGVYLEVELLAGPPAATPLATVSLSVYPDRDLPSIKGVRFFQAPAADVMMGTGALIALVNGSHSNAGARLVAVLPPPPELTSHGALGLTRAGRGLALAFTPDDPGEGRVTISAEAIDAVSDWPARPIRPEGDTSRMRICYQPDGDGMEALRALFVPTSPVDRERLAGTPAPAGWSSGRERRASLTEADVIAHADFCAEHFDRGLLRFIELGEGYQRSAGDWDTNERFAQGHRWLTDQIRSRKFQAGLWLAPFGVSEPSGIPAAHPDWLVRNEDDTPTVLETREDWGGAVFALDGAHPAARQWLFDLARRVVQEWGYDYLRLDRLRWAVAGGSHYGGLTPAEACRLGLGALRDGAGADAFLIGSDAALQHSVGFVNAMRVGPDEDTGWLGIQAAARATALRSFYHRGVWLNDPDSLRVGPPLSLGEARLWTSIVALSGGMAVLADDLTTLDPERLALIARALPVSQISGRPISAARADLGWIVEGAPRWWTVVLANWDDEAREYSVPRDALGLAGARFTAYDVWSDTPLLDLTDAVRVKLAPHSCITIGIRPAAARPQVIGTTRHLVQGAMDVADETWDAPTKTLRARATKLDRRAYGITIAHPKGMQPLACKANSPCSIRPLGSEHLVLEWGAGGDGRDVTWAVTFKQQSAAKKPGGAAGKKKRTKKT